MSGRGIAKALLTALTMAVLFGGVISVCAEDASWNGEIICGLNMTAGNSDTAVLNVELRGERKWTANELRAGAQYAYGESDDETTVDNGKADAQYDRLLTERAFVFVNGQVSRDDIAMIDYRLIVGSGMGHHLIKSEGQNLRIELGASCIRERMDGTLPAGDEIDSSVALRVLLRHDGALGETAQLWESVEYMPDFDNFGDCLLNAEIGVETTITSRLSLRVTANDKYNSDPAPGVDRNDIAASAALVLKLGG